MPRWRAGGILKSVNGGTSWTTIFDDEAVPSVGDVAISPSNPSIVWAGTGESNNRQSSSWGNGVYKSMDAGKTWKNMGLTGHSPHRPHRRSPDKSGHRLCRGDGQPVGTERGPRRLQDDRRRPKRGSTS